jgi:sugar phosphate permease
MRLSATANQEPLNGNSSGGQLPQAHDAQPNISSLTASSLYRKIAWRIMPLLFICYIVAYIDRVNVGFAKLQMIGNLKFSDGVYGLGAGIFFLGYFL